MNVVFIGPPGAGKGTQAKILSDRTGALHLSTGDILREAIRRQTKIGLIAKALIDVGQFVPDDVALSLVVDRLDGEPSPVVLDGVPRTVAQAYLLERAFAEMGRSVDVAIELMVQEDDLINRIRRRAVETVEAGSTARPDDDPDVFRSRLTHYRDLTMPVLRFYADRKVLISIDASGDIDAVAGKLTEKLAGRTGP